MFDEIAAAFPLARAYGVIFAWGDAIYSPSVGTISTELKAHEAVHLERQGGHPRPWWERYISDPVFRLEEEIPAHQAQYREFCARNTHGRARNMRRVYLHQVAKSLSSPLYGGLIGYDAARKLIKEAA